MRELIKMSPEGELGRVEIYEIPLSISDSFMPPIKQIRAYLGYFHGLTCKDCSGISKLTFGSH